MPGRQKNKGIHVKYRPDRKCWEVIEWIRGRRKRHATGLCSAEEAQERLAEIILERKSPEQNTEEITLGEIISLYIRDHMDTLARPDTAEKCFERLIPFWGDLKLSEITRQNSQKYIKYREAEFNKWQAAGDWKNHKTLKPQTVRRELEQLQAAIGFVYRENLINICPHIWKPEKSQPRDSWLTHKQVAELLRAARSMKRAKSYLPLFILIGVYTGARSEAISKLRWHQVDFENNIIDFTKNQTNNIKKSSRVKMPKRLRREMIKAKSSTSNIGYVVNNRGQRVKSVKNGFGTACELAGLEGYTPHCLRHTAVSWMMQKSISPVKIGEYVGMSPQMVINVYGHLDPEHLKEAVESYG